MESRAANLSFGSVLCRRKEHTGRREQCATRVQIGSGSLRMMDGDEDGIGPCHNQCLSNPRHLGIRYERSQYVLRESR